MKDNFRLCRKCGRPVGVISPALYKNILVDAEAVEVVPDKMGDIFIRIDGSKIRGRVAEFTESGKEYCYRQHRCESDT